MFTLNAFGQRVRCNKRIRFVTDDDQNPGGGDGGTPKTPQELGFKFPADTPIANMSAEEKAEYYRHKAEKHEKRANSRRDYDDLKAKADAFDQAQKDALTDQEKAVDAAREEARLEGETIGAGRYLKEAVTARFQLLTGKSDEEVATAFAHIDTLSFTNDQGGIELEKLKTFAATFGTSGDGGKKGDPVAEALARQRQAGGGSASSMKERREQTRDKLSKKKTNA